MLPPRHRLRRSADFTAVMRGGQRAARNTVVVHVLGAPATEAPATGTPVATEPPPATGTPVATGPTSATVPTRPPGTPQALDALGAVAVSRFGLVVGRTVGNSVTRHQVSRRLRGLLADRVERLPVGSDVVVRARPEAAGADSHRLGIDLDAALDTLARRAARTGGQRR